MKASRAYSPAIASAVLILTVVAGCATESHQAVQVEHTASAATAYQGPRNAIAVGKFDNRSTYLRGLFSKFKDFGQDWIYSPGINGFVTSPSDANNTCGITNVAGVQGCGGITFTDVYRNPGERIFSVQAGARHAIKSTLLAYEVALSQANYTGGFPRAGFNGPGSSDNSVAFAVDTKDPFTPKFPVLNGVNLYDPSAYTLSYAQTENDGIFERDAVGAISLNKQYSLGLHSSSFEVGFKGWDARKTSLIDRENFNAASDLVKWIITEIKVL